jgi:hypothetical protein
MKDSTPENEDYSNQVIIDYRVWAALFFIVTALFMLNEAYPEKSGLLDYFFGGCGNNPLP